MNATDQLRLAARQKFEAAPYAVLDLTPTLTESVVQQLVRENRDLKARVERLEQLISAMWLEDGQPPLRLVETDHA